MAVPCQLARVRAHAELVLPTLFVVDADSVEALHGGVAFDRKDSVNIDVAPNSVVLTADLDVEERVAVNVGVETSQVVCSACVVVLQVGNKIVAGEVVDVGALETFPYGAADADLGAVARHVVGDQCV